MPLTKIIWLIRVPKGCKVVKMIQDGFKLQGSTYAFVFEKD